MGKILKFPTKSRREEAKLTLSPIGKVVSTEELKGYTYDPSRVDRLIEFVKMANARTRRIMEND